MRVVYLLRGSAVGGRGSTTCERQQYRRQQYVMSREAVQHIWVVGRSSAKGGHIPSRAHHQQGECTKASSQTNTAQHIWTTPKENDKESKTEPTWPERLGGLERK